MPIIFHHTAILIGLHSVLKKGLVWHRQNFCCILILTLSAPSFFIPLRAKWDNVGLTDSEFKSALEQYANALKVLKDELAALKTEKSKPRPQPWLADEICLDVFIARDKIQEYLAAKESSIQKCLPELSQLDKQLREQIFTIAQTFPLAEWRRILDPPPSAWWWQGEAPEVTDPWNRLDWLCEVLTIPVLTVNFALVVSISSRFLAWGPDALGAFAVIGQSVVAMLSAGAPLTRAGQKIIEQRLRIWRLPKSLWHQVKLMMAVMALFSLLGLQASLPNIAKFYVQRGIAARRKLQTNSALAEYKRAIALDPTNLEAHYRSSVIYEDLQDFTKANSEYRIAMLGGCVEAINNLGRLYIVEKGDAATAASLLARAHTMVQNRADASGCTQADVDLLKYSVSKNLGWAKFIQARYTEARGYLEEAIFLDPERAAPYCLLAQVIESSANEADANTEEIHPDALLAWESCLDYANTLRIEEDEWLNMAEQRLEKTLSD